MKIFPSKELEFRLIGYQDETIERLNRRTERSENLSSQYTDKSFRGIVNGNHFKLISSAIGRGAFCVMTGEITSGGGHLKVEIHKVFKVLLSILLLFPVIGLIALAVTTGTEDVSPFMVVVAVAQLLIIRYAFIGLAFRFLSNASVNRLRDVLDLEWIKNRAEQPDSFR